MLPVEHQHEAESSSREILNLRTELVALLSLLTLSAVVAQAKRPSNDIFTTPQIALFASIEQGGNITYWGEPRVESSVKHGGDVTKGNWSPFAEWRSE